ncbi:MAG: MBL fold metallo-hydrolase [Fibrella sp.]|nr:MBL fold metallo-hydrolase [Armatimonadota bacterium]
MVFYKIASSTAAISLALATLSASSVFAQTPAPKLSKAQAGFHRMTVGTFEVIALSDGTVPLPALGLLTGAKPGEVERLFADAYQKLPLDASVNAYLILAGPRRILVDTGSGELYGPTLFKLPASLEAVGYKTDQITDILVTHIHTDHTGGLMDGTRKVFPNAVLHVEKRELVFWMDPTNLKDVPEDRKELYKKLFEEAATKVKPYVASGQVKTFDGETELFPGIRSLPTPGHTPGHSFYALENNGEKMVFWGDIMHVAEVQFPNPAITIKFDFDSKAAAVQRKKAYADAAKNGYLVAPAHVSFPGVGHLRPDGKGYRWIPIPYVNDTHIAK